MYNNDKDKITKVDFGKGKHPFYTDYLTGFEYRKLSREDLDLPPINPTFVWIGFRAPKETFNDPYIDITNHDKD